MADTFEKFTGQARKVFSLAQEEAQRLNHNYIGTEHLLLGIVREGDGIAARVLDNLGVSLSKVRSAVEFIIGRGDGLVVGDPGLTPRAKKVIELTMDEARRLNNDHIGSKHLLLGLVRGGEGVAASVLGSLGVSLERVRLSVMNAVVEQASQTRLTAHPPMSPQSPLLPFLPLRMLGFQDKEIRRLDAIAKQQNRLIDDLIREAVRRVWLPGTGETATPPQSPA